MYVQPLLHWKCVLHNLRVCICSLRYPACNAHAPCCHLWPAPFYNIFPRCPINGTIFGKKKVTENRMCVFIFSTTFVWNISHSKKKWERNGTKYILFLIQSPLYYRLRLIKLEYSRQIFEKTSNIKFHENRSSGSRVVVCRRTAG